MDHETARLVALHEAGRRQKDIAESPSAVWHCLRRLGLRGPGSR
jgi:hypothetical protein